jgi:hypothetical protein
LRIIPARPGLGNFRRSCWIRYEASCDVPSKLPGRSLRPGGTASQPRA